MTCFLVSLQSQGSTTGQAADNDSCRASGGMVTWHVDRGCHMASAKAIDNLCKNMLLQKDDMSEDVTAHGSRATVSPEFTTNAPMRDQPEDDDDEDDDEK